MIDNLELRMYGMVPYNISPIQQGIQYGHAVVEYGQKMRYLGSLLQSHTQPLVMEYNKWADEWKTFIILNGGTTNTNPERLGSLNQHLQTLTDIGLFCVPFYEPDLGDQLTAISFIIDERIFNREKYPDYIEESMDSMMDITTTNAYKIWTDQFDDTEDNVEKIIKLREFLHPNNFRLA